MERKRNAGSRRSATRISLRSIRATRLRVGNVYVTNFSVHELRYYVGSGGKQPFGEWFEDLEPVARAKVTRALVQLGHGNFSNVKSVGEGVLEYRIDSGPGYRVYFGRDGDTLIILLTGGTKRRQQRDIEAAYLYWRDYKQSRRGRR